jgi:hypothetical protein
MSLAATVNRAFKPGGFSEYHCAIKDSVVVHMSSDTVLSFSHSEVAVRAVIARHASAQAVPAGTHNSEPPSHIHEICSLRSQ